jgi:hypothetical protein
MSLEPSRMSTRPSNINKHPGHEQNKYSLTRRSPADVAAEKAAKKAAKAEQAVQIEAGLKEVAEIERQTQQKQKNQKKHTGVITLSNTAIPRKHHKRPPPAVLPETIVDSGMWIPSTEFPLVLLMNKFQAAAT